MPRVLDSAKNAHTTHRISWYREATRQGLVEAAPVFMGNDCETRQEELILNG